MSSRDEALELEPLGGDGIAGDDGDGAEEALLGVADGVYLEDGAADADGEANAGPQGGGAFYDDEEDEALVPLSEQALSVMAILKPVTVTMLLVVAIVRTINIPGSNNVTVAMAYHEQESDSTGTKFLGSILNALIFVGIVTLTTVVFVLLYKYRCMKVLYGWLVLSTVMLLSLFGGLLSYLVLASLNMPMDWFTFSVLLWNFSVVGVTSIFWYAPAIVNQVYLIIISALMAVFFTRLPEWTTWALLAAIAIYDVFAVLCPGGPLRQLVETAQQRQETIPALLYNGMLWLTMAVGVSDDDDDVAEEGAYAGLGEPNIDRIDVEVQADGDSDEEEGRRGGVKLGLGDFVFYSVLVGRAALFDIVTVFTSFIAIVVGLFFTILCLAIFRRALPALPFSIALGMTFFFLTRFFLLPYILFLGADGVFV